MARFGVSFIIDKRHLGDLVEDIQPYKVEHFEMKLVADATTKVARARIGDKPAWQIAADLASSSPRPISFFVQALVKAGFKKTSAYGGLDQAYARRLIRKTTIKGVVNYTRSKK